MTQRIRYARPGDRLSANYVNQLVDGANLALVALDGPASKRQAAAGGEAVDADAQGTGDIEGVGNKTYTETARSTSTVRITDPNDPEVYVDVARIDRIEFESDDGRITLVFDNA